MAARIAVFGGGGLVEGVLGGAEVVEQAGVFGAGFGERGEELQGALEVVGFERGVGLLALGGLRGGLGVDVGLEVLGRGGGRSEGRGRSGGTSRRDLDLFGMRGGVEDGGEPVAGVAGGVGGDLFGRADGDDLAAGVSALGPMSMTQSADLMTSRLCSMTRSEPPPSMSLRKAARSLATSSKWRPVVGSSRM